MKKIFIVSSVLLVAVAGYVASMQIFDCASGCSYDSKMSMICEFSCGAKDVEESKVVAQSKAHAGDFTKCPVSGVVFHVTQESTKIQHEGKSAFTCCGTCAELFKAEPAAYVANLQAP